MRKNRLKHDLLLILAVCTIATVAGLTPVTARAGEDELAAEIARLTEAVNRLAAVQAADKNDGGQDVKLRRLTLAITYLDYRSRRIEALEQEMSANRSAQERLDDFLRQIERREVALEEERRNNPQLSQQEADRTGKELDEQKKMIATRSGRIDGKLIQLENEIIELKSQLVATERYVQSNLDF